jgi:hypothetical protein
MNGSWYKPAADLTTEERNVGVMAEWVNRSAWWSVYGTFTYRWESGLWPAVKAFDRFMRRPELVSTSYFYAIESNPSRDGFHVHAIIAGWPKLLRRSTVWQAWFKAYGRNRVTPIVEAAEYWRDPSRHQTACSCDRSQAVADYVSKYVAKEGVWWNLRLVAGQCNQRDTTGKFVLLA